MQAKRTGAEKWQQFFHRDAGTALMEYVLLAALASVVFILAVLAFSSSK